MRVALSGFTLGNKPAGHWPELQQNFPPAHQKILGKTFRNRGTLAELQNDLPVMATASDVRLAVWFRPPLGGLDRRVVPARLREVPPHVRPTCRISAPDLISRCSAYNAMAVLSARASMCIAGISATATSCPPAADMGAKVVQAGNKCKCDLADEVFMGFVPFMQFAQGQGRACRALSIGIQGQLGAQGHGQRAAKLAWLNTAALIRLSDQTRRLGAPWWIARPR